MISQIFGLISILLSVYSFIIFIRIIFSWFNLRNNFNGHTQNKVINFLYSITDPYLNWFRRFSFLRIGMIDFSAMIAISLLYFVSSITSRIAAIGTITLPFIIKLIISTIWSLASSLIIILVIILIIRFVFIQLHKHSNILTSMDGYLEPIARKFSNIFTKKFTPYKTNILILAGVLFIARLAINYLLMFLYSLF